MLPTISFHLLSDSCARYSEIHFSLMNLIYVMPNVIIALSLSLCVSVCLCLFVHVKHSSVICISHSFETKLNISAYTLKLHSGTVPGGKEGEGKTRTMHKKKKKITESVKAHV